MLGPATDSSPLQLVRRWDCNFAELTFTASRSEAFFDPESQHMEASPRSLAEEAIKARSRERHDGRVLHLAGEGQSRLKALQETEEKDRGHGGFRFSLDGLLASAEASNWPGIRPARKAAGCDMLWGMTSLLLSPLETLIPSVFLLWMLLLHRAVFVGSFSTSFRDHPLSGDSPPRCHVPLHLSYQPASTTSQATKGSTLSCSAEARRTLLN